MCYTSPAMLVLSSLNRRPQIPPYARQSLLQMVVPLGPGLQAALHPMIPVVFLVMSGQTFMFALVTTVVFRVAVLPIMGIPMCPFAMLVMTRSYSGSPVVLLLNTSLLGLPLAVLCMSLTRLWMSSVAPLRTV